MSCRNVGSADRVVRGLIGIVAIVVAVTMLDAASGAVPGIIAAAVGVILLLTAAVGVCPLYLPFKLSTCKVKTP